MFYLIAGAVAAYAVYHTFFAGDQDDRPPSPSQSHESSQPPVRPRPEPQHRQNDIDSFQEDYPPVETHESLRARARQEGNLMAQCSQQSQEAYERRDHARAKTLSDESKGHARKMETLDAKASAIIYKENNQDRAACEVDLHGLYVKEAIAYSEKALTKARQRGESEIRLIVGQGNHSDGGTPRLKPAIQKAMQIYGVDVEVDPRNPGVLLVLLSGQ